MPLVLTTNASVLCPHGGVGTSQPIPPPRIAKIAGGDVLLEGDQGTLTCPFIVPCIGYALQSMGLNATTVQGRKVMLVSDFVQSFTGFPLTITETHWVSDKTLPGTPPDTGAAVPPELGEDDVPSVTVVPPTLPFSIATFGLTSLPATLPFVFTLSSAYPLRWILWQVGPPATSLELTNGLPPNVTVAPPGGGWSASPLTVTVTVAGTYAATLVPGEHTFVLTGVNRRGFSAFAEAKLVVSP